MSRRLGLLLLVSCATTPPPAPTAVTPPVDHGASIAPGRARLIGLLTSEPLAGLQAAVAVRGEIVWSEGFGVADLDAKVPVTPRTRFRFASVSKVVTAALLARAVERGQLDLDAPIQTYVPAFAQKDPGITARRLAGHLGGIRHYTFKDFVGRGQPTHYANVVDGLALFADDPLVAPPGTRYFYSTFGYSLLSAALEKALGRPFLGALAAEVFVPLGMTDAGPDDVTVEIPTRTRFYERRDDGTLGPAPVQDSSAKWAGGGLLGTAEDLVRLGSAHRVEAGFFAPKTLELLLRSQQLPDGSATGVGLAWRSAVDAGGRRYVHHAGNMAGARAVLLFYPDAGVAIAILSNVSGRPAAIEDLALEVVAPFL